MAERESGREPEKEGPEILQDDLRRAWHVYVDVTAPLRPALHAYCRRLTGNLWDAEDLVQDTLLRAFGHLGFMHREVRSPRAYLLRTATNVWIDAQRRRRTGDAADPRDLPAPSAPPGPGVASDVREAGGRLFARLSPQQRAAVVLKDVFEMTLEEIAELLATTTGAVKAALHKGRGRLRDRDRDRKDAAERDESRGTAVDRFIACWEERDVEGLVALMLEGGSAENVGFGLEYGSESFRDEHHFLYKAVHGHEEWPAELQPEAVRLARGEIHGEPVVLCFATRRGREALEQVLRIDAVDGRIARLRGYAFCPETMREIGELLGLAVRTGLYRVPTPEPGRFYPDP